ncbi:hypothetical protein MMYC01_206864 [Madurella mycetomatis]|uniref:Uncharacterized protein n=1 Tax=Madurella mycetomatis TaxID=100816 RepID=A0A175VZI3_9PEZI|nr:hypothetical protein MMYC01_206864 [Madurella mycetomatis]
MTTSRRAKYLTELKSFGPGEVGCQPTEAEGEENRVIGNTILRSGEPDCSLIEVDGAVIGSTIRYSHAVILDNPVQIEPSLRHVTVRAETAGSGIIEGILSASSCYPQLPHSGSFYEAYEAKFVRSLASGDCGSWVRDGTTGRVCGHIFAGS